MINKTEQYIKSMLKNNLFTVVYPRDRSQKSAQKMIEMIDSAIGIADKLTLAAPQLITNNTAATRL